MSAAESTVKSNEQTRQHGLEVMSIQEHHELAAQGGEVRRGDSLDDCIRLVEYIKSFQM